jgi:hypothetical protein
MARISALALVLLLSQAIATSAPQVAEVREPTRSQPVKPTEQDARERPKEHVKSGKTSSNKALTKEGRLAFIRQAQVWTPTTVSAMNLRVGPQGRGAIPPNAMVTCDYVDAKLPGTSRKFRCLIGADDIVKVRYGANNGEVQGAVLTSRLLWALGFGADRVYPVRLTCRGCSSDPWTNHQRATEEQVFDPAAIERKPDGHEMKTDKDAGWAWSELALIDEAQGGAPVAHRDALTLLAVFLQHTDSKPEQQRLLCLPGGATGEGGCSKPFMILHDVGLTFGHGNFSNRAEEASVNFDEWAKTPVWRDAHACVGHLSKSHTGTLGDPTIHEAGRSFLAGLLIQLTDEQLHDLFEVARVDARSRNPNSSAAGPPASVNEWVTAFKHKREEIVANRCPS